MNNLDLFISKIGFFEMNNLDLFIWKIGFFKMNNLDLFIWKIRFFEMNLSEATADASYTVFVPSKKTPGLPSPRQSVEVDCMVSSFQLTIRSNTIMASPEADPLGILRATIGNMAAVMARISAHNKAMFAILPAGPARHHDPKPAAALRTERFFGEPVISKIGFFNLDFNY